MPWTGAYGIRGEEELTDNVLAILTSDFKAALDIRYPTEALLASTHPEFLADFAERSVGQVIGNEAPMLAIGPIRNAGTPAEDQSHFIEVVRLDLALGVTADSAALVTQKIMRYTLTTIAVLHTAAEENKAAFVANMSSPFGLVLETEAIYRPLRGNDSIYFRDSTVELTIQIRER